LQAVKPEKQYQYDLFKIQWGWFGVLGTNDGLVRTQLADTEKGVVKKRLLQGVEGAKQKKSSFSVLKLKILAYYQGKPVNFNDVKVDIGDFTPFQQKVFRNLRKVKSGKTVTYGQLARLAGSPKAARAIGSVMAANPLPLIIPCHRVIKSDGTCGQFSAPGGTQTKKRMLNLEKM
jgi:methylated-DNA-[protein]-cysteine S-methyltransferase